MDVGQLKLFDMMKHRMDWLGQRQRVIAQNVANADTPDYEAKELKALDFAKVLKKETGLKSMRMTRTTGSHITGTADNPGFKNQMRPKNYEITPTGNQVNLEDQMMRQSETAEAYKLTTTLYNKYTSMMKLAVKGTQ